MTPHVEALLIEYMRVCNDIRALEAGVARVIFFGVLVVSIGFLYAANTLATAVFYLLPIASLAVLLYAGLTYQHILFFGGYKRYLEERLNTLLGGEIFFWELLAEQRGRMGVGTIALPTAYTLLLCGIACSSIRYVFIMQGSVRGLLLLAASVGFCIALILLLRSMVGSFQEGYTRAKAQGDYKNLH